ncbi:SGNH/GDSL hydrolase family protein [Streptomyces sp. NPDC004609]|uniref:SGNH/GDSL hydrolase family protein n=1 Tax=Streptomyces sp. NPDC004609 TaxID=3364704 RepID=UPI0036C7041A
MPMRSDDEILQDRAARVLGAVAAVTLGLVSPTATAQGELEWVALGDSYTAGIFAGPEQGEADGCERTRDAYPQVVSRRLEAEPPAHPVSLVADVSCGGATIANIAEEPQTPIGRNQPPDGWPQVKPQVEAAGLDTDVVSVGVGGNSVPFGTVLLNCVTLGSGRPGTATPCRDAYENDPPATDPETIDEKYTRLAREYHDMLGAVSRQAPGAELVTVGYPSIVPADVSSCSRTDRTHFSAGLFGSITHGDLDWLRGVTEELNAIIERSTAAYGARYVDVYTSSKGHDVCQPRGEKWVEGVCGPPESDHPIDLDALCAGLPEGQRRLTLVHPNSEGHANTAALVEEAIRTIAS